MADSPSGPGNYYEILGVIRTATPKEIETAFRNLARKWHPDVCADVHQAAANFKRIAEAYEVLGDPGKRRRYDEAEQKRHRRRVSVSTARPRPAQEASRVGVFGAEVPFELFSGFDSILESLFGSDWARPAAAPPQPRPELDVEAELRLTPEEAHRGGPVQFKLHFDQACPECVGRGKTVGAVCGTCGGKGRIQQGPRIVTVKVPPGVWSGSVIRIPGEGKSPPHAGPPGDLVLRVRVQPCW
jgi:DnaJ-class molecular chaperone